MSEISRFLGIIIRMFFNEHNPPHFHVQYNEFSCEVHIETLEIIKGNLPRKVYQLVLEWAVEHRNELKEDWELMRMDMAPNKIESLV